MQLVGHWNIHEGKGLYQGVSAICPDYKLLITPNTINTIQSPLL